MILAPAINLILGCGYLGRRVANAWLTVGRRVCAVTRSGDRASELSRMEIQPIVADICDPDTLTDLPAADTVLFAVGYDRTSGKTQREVYVDGLNAVLERIRHKIKRFIYISSSSVYGQSDGEWVDEASPCQPSQPGGICCLAAEALVRATFPRTEIAGSPQADILRLSGIYGPNRLLTRIESLVAGQTIAGRGDAWLNLIHVDDAVQAVLACETRGLPGDLYLVTDDLPIQRAEYFGVLARQVGASPPTFDSMMASRHGSGGINKRCTNRKLHDVLGIALRYPTINEGLIQSLQAGPEVFPPAR